MQKDEVDKDQFSIVSQNEFNKLKETVDLLVVRISKLEQNPIEPVMAVDKSLVMNDK